jgi:hypothetical protein
VLLLEQLDRGQSMEVVVRTLLADTAVGLEQLLSKTGNDVDHLVQIRGARIPQHGVANNLPRGSTSERARRATGLPNSEHIAQGRAHR